MRAAVYTRYGPPEVVALAEVAKPVREADELLVKVRATTVNRTDCGVRQADPVLVRLFTGLTRARNTILGSEFAGDVEAVGPQVRSFTDGEAVFGLSGDGQGTHAQYVCVRESGSVARKPANMEGDSGGATAVFYGCRSEVGADRAPADD